VIFHRKSDSKPIRSDAERERAAAQVEFLQAAVAKIAQGKSSRRTDSMAAKVEQVMCSREDQIREYDALKRGELKLPKIERLDDVPPLIPSIRIARGVSQTELAHRIGVSKQVISRYEESDYQSAGLTRLREILDALGVRTQIQLS
jgi:ribosome-binding protein aMBF1 (putative translation factor)